MTVNKSIHSRLVIVLKSVFPNVSKNLPAASLECSRAVISNGIDVDILSPFVL